MLRAAILALCVGISAGLSISGQWQSTCQPSSLTGSSNTIYKITSTTISAQIQYFSGDECSIDDIMFTVRYFGSYYIGSKLSRSLNYGFSANATQDARTLFYGRSKAAIVPNSASGASFLTGFVSSTSNCASRTELKTFDLGVTKDVSFTNCIDLDLVALPSCTTLHTSIFRDGDNLYLGDGTVSQKCSASFPLTANFNPGNCLGLDETCFPVAYQKVSLPNIQGEWSLPCQNMTIDTGNGSISLSQEQSWTFSQSQYSLSFTTHFGGGCVSPIINIYAFGNYMLNSPVGSEGAFSVKASILSRFVVAPSAESATNLNQFISRDTTCMTELGPFTAGEFKMATFRNCPTFGIQSQSVCPTIYFSVNLISPTSLSLGLPTRQDFCTPSSTFRETILTQTTSADTDLEFGASMPLFFFGPSQQARTTMSLFETGYKNAVDNNDFSYISQLVTEDFSLIYPGSFAFDPVAGTYGNVEDTPNYEPLQRFLSAWKNQYEMIGSHTFDIYSADPSTSVVHFSDTFYSKTTNKVAKQVGALWTFFFRAGKIYKIEITLDTLASAISNCPSGLMCGQSPPVTWITTITNSNFTTISSSVYSVSGADQAEMNAEAEREKNLDIYKGLSAIVVVLSVIVLFLVFLAARAVLRLKETSGIAPAPYQRAVTQRRKQSAAEMELGTVPAPHFDE